MRSKSRFGKSSAATALGFLGAALLLFCGSARIASAQVPADRLAKLRQGISLTDWVRPEGGKTPRFRIVFGPADLSLVRSMGFGYVRLPVDPTMLEGHWSCVDRAVQMILKQGLAVVVDVHDWRARIKLVNDPSGIDAFTRFWERFARHFSYLDPSRVFFELLGVDAPEFKDPGSWNLLQGRLVSKIRRFMPNQTLIVLEGSDPERLAKSRPLKDPDLIYDFHFYLPGIFTHQGATWATPYFRYLRGIPYPLGPKDEAGILSELPSKSDQELFLTTYGSHGTPLSLLDKWDAARIGREISVAARWAAAAHVPLLCEEFGVYRKYSDPRARAAWIGDVRSALEKNRIGWAFWGYEGSFGLVSRKGGKLEPDTAILDALGLSRR